MTAAQARRPVAVDLPVEARRCLYCLEATGPFRSREHVVPRRLCGRSEEHVLPPGVVCDPCNHFVGKQVEAPFTDRFDIALTRGLEGIPDRHGNVLDLIDGHSPTSRLDVQAEAGGPTVQLFASTTEHADGLDIEIRPKHPEPPDIVARTFRALWKIALGAIYMGHGSDAALAPRWDHLRQVVLGQPFKGFVAQAPFEATTSGELKVGVDITRPADWTAVTFVLGGVALAVPLDPGAKASRDEVRRCGWDVKPTDAPPDSRILLRLEGKRAA